MGDLWSLNESNSLTHVACNSNTKCPGKPGGYHDNLLMQNAGLCRWKQTGMCNMYMEQKELQLLVTDGVIVDVLL